MPKRIATLARTLARLHPEVVDPDQAIRDGQVTVDGRIVTNPASIVGPGSHIALQHPAPLRGEAKLQAALARFPLAAAGRIALDVGAAAGGFTRTLLAHGAARVYAVDAGHGQLLGSLRQDPRVVNLEATNLGSLNRALVPDVIDLVTLDLSYLSLTAAIPQLDAIAIAADADLVALVKPMFELQLSRPPGDRPRLEEALQRAIEGVGAAGWRVLSTMESPVLGSRGAVEFLIHAHRR